MNLSTHDNKDPIKGQSAFSNKPDPFRKRVLFDWQSEKPEWLDEDIWTSRQGPEQHVRYLNPVKRLSARSSSRNQGSSGQAGNFSEHQVQLAGGLGNSGVGDEPRDFEVGLDLQGEGIRQLSNFGGSTIEIDEDLNQCLSDRAAYEAALLAGNIANEALENALEDIAGVNATILALEIQSYYNTFALPFPLWSWTHGQKVRCFAGGTGNRVAFERVVPFPLYSTRVADFGPAPGFNASGGPAMAIFDAAGNNLSGAYSFSDSLPMASCGMFLAGDTCTIRYYWFAGSGGQITPLTDQLLFTCTATSATTFDITLNKGSYHLDNYGTVPKP